VSKVLYLDDTADQRNLVEMVLNSIGLDVETGADGEEGLRKVAQNPPDLILLDLRMPKINGFEFLKIIKEQSDTQNIPVVVISAWANKAARDEVMGAGAIDFLIKPYEIDDLIAMVQKYLQ
jgi:CheY-like chemotaxis protein